ncbi:MAG: phytanoyl-CoA dioxygenase family protein [Acidimicrobiales bacterium]|nr:phytanoyl-CoA dioxygenase family protein [Acidimicrobiales bacterium]
MSGGGGGETTAEAVADAGHIAVADLLAPSEVAEARAALDAVFTSEADIAVERGWRTDAHLVAYALPAKHPALLRLCLHPGAVALAREVLGDDAVLAGANGLDLPPGSTGQALHRDHPHPTPGITLYLHVVVALDDFRAENGATLVVPASHRPPLAERVPAELADRAVPVVVPPGAAVAFDGALVHAAGPNRTDERRRALHLFFARPWVQPHWDLPATIGDAASALGDEQRRLLGFGPGPRRWDPQARRVVR